MSLDVTIGYPKMGCSTSSSLLCLQTRDDQETLVQCSNVFKPYPSELKLFLYYYLA